MKKYDLLYCICSIILIYHLIKLIYFIKYEKYIIYENLFKISFFKIVILTKRKKKLSLLKTL